MSIAPLKRVLEGNWSSRLRSAGLLVMVGCKMSSCQAEEDSGKNNTYSGTSLKWARLPRARRAWLRPLEAMVMLVTFGPLQHKTRPWEHRPGYDLRLSKAGAGWIF